MKPLKAPIHGAFLFSNVQRWVLQADPIWGYRWGYGGIQLGVSPENANSGGAHATDRNSRQENQAQ